MTQNKLFQRVLGLNGWKEERMLNRKHTAEFIQPLSVPELHSSEVSHAYFTYLQERDLKVTLNSTVCNFDLMLFPGKCLISK